MVNARSFSLQITMLDILHLYLGNSITDFLRNSELPDNGLAFIKSYRWADSLTFKQELLSRINGSREHDEINLIMSKPLHSVKFGDTLVACSVSEFPKNVNVCKSRNVSINRIWFEGSWNVVTLEHVVGNVWILDWSTNDYHQCKSDEKDRNETVNML